MVSRRLLRIKIFQILYAFFKNDDGETLKFKKELNFSIEKTQELYFKFLLLLVEIRVLAINKIELAKNKHLPTLEDLNPNTKFVDNPVLIFLSENERLNKLFEAKKISWQNDSDLVKKLFKKMLESEYYQKYMNVNTKEKADKQILFSFLEQTVLECDDIVESLENDSIYWNDELEFVIDMVIKTIKSIKLAENDIEILPLYKNQQDKEFAENLFLKTIKYHNENRDLITKYVKNWDADRLAFNDLLFMEMAITEFKHFSDIPVRVSLNEYIELSKFYSTKQSSGFINGILDKIIKDLKKTGEIKKTGMGLKGEI